MALHLLPSRSLPAWNFTRLPNNGFVPGRVQCKAAPTDMPLSAAPQTVVRRSANYQPPIWGYDYVQSLRSKFAEEAYAKRVKKLKEDVRVMLDKLVDEDPLQQLELIDTLQRLGLSYHFMDEIKRILSSIYSNNNHNYRNKQKQGSLYAVGLEFRLLRQHGYDIPQEIFSIFKDEKGKFKSCLSEDSKGILALYEAAYLFVEGESIFHEVISFTTKYLKGYVKHNNDQYLSTLVKHALELPLHWRMLRLEARWFIDVYERGPYMNPILLELAKLDFNIVQATHQEDLKYASRWWSKTGLGEKLSFARDRLMENFFWTVGIQFDPRFVYLRRMCTKVNALITTIDDIYDVYGTLDELELFTDAVDRWDVNAMDQLPYYMKLCFHVLHSSINEMAFEALKEQGVHIIPYLKKAVLFYIYVFFPILIVLFGYVYIYATLKTIQWADLCKSYLLEAKWYNSGYTPTLQEYIDNAWISISASVTLIHAYIFITNPITKEALEYLKEYPNIIRWSSVILRLADDIGTSSHEMERGDVAKSIQCYMHETGASEEKARQHIRKLIATTWMKMNKDRFGNPHLSNTFIGIAMNLARMAQCMYQHGDGHASQDRRIVDRISSLLIHPFLI